MTNNRVTAARLHQHPGRNLSGERPLFFPVNILRRNPNLRSPRRFHRRRDAREWRSNHNIAIHHSRHQRVEPREKCARVRLRLIHLPVAGNHPPPFLCAHLFVKASTPGSFRPPRNSSEAPPPVEMCEILSATPALCTAAAESPPPIIEVAPDAVALATAFAISSVPLANAGISNTPIGPFHTIVLAFAISALYAAIVFGPMSSPIWSAGVVPASTTFDGASALHSGATT